MSTIRTPPPAGQVYEAPPLRPTIAMPAPAPPVPPARLLAHRVALLAVIAAAALVALSPLVPPSVVPATAPATQFSAERAMRHVNVVARAPRPVGSPQHAMTRAHIVGEIERLGLRAEVQRATSVLRFPGAPGFNAGWVENVIARLPGASSTGTVLLGAHYDGGATGPAAADCGACVATLLETLRALRAGPAARNDVVFVFTDGEEVGDLGAHAFATDHPVMDDVRVSLNFEAMGDAGPASLYATSPRNARLVAEVARAAPHVVASSFFAALHRGLPALRAACDLQDYMNAGSAGLGFILAGGSAAYHTMRDDARHLDQRSVQHFGAYALPLAQRFGAMDLATLDARTDATFFTPWRGAVVTYAHTWVIPVAVLALLLLAGTLAMGVRRGVTSPRGVALASGAFLGSVAATVLVVTAVWGMLRTVDGNLRVFLIGGYATGWYLGGLLALAVALMAAMHAWLRPRLGALHLLAGALVGLGVLTAATALYFPAGAYVFTWPLVAGLVPLAWLVLAPAARAGEPRWMRTVVIAAGIAPAVMVLVPVGLDMFLGLLVRLEGMTGAPLMAGATTFVAMLTGLLLALYACAVDGLVDEEGGPRRRWLLARRAGVLSLVLLMAATVRQRFDAAHPRPGQVRYELDADRGHARWVTSDDRLDAWSSRFIPAGTPREAGVGYGVPNGPATYSAAAPVLPFPAPEVEVLEDALANGIRVVRLQLRSARGAPTLEVQLRSETPIIGARIGGEPLDVARYAPAARGELQLRYAPMPAGGVELVVGTQGAAPLLVTMVDWSDGLPAYPGAPSYVRPPGTMPAPGGTLDGIAVRHAHYVIPELGDGPVMALRAGAAAGASERIR